MPAYKYTLKNGKTKWYANFYYDDWTGEKKHKCKRGFDRKSDAEKYELDFLNKYSSDPTIIFSGLVDNYLEDMKERLKVTTMATKINIINTKILPYFANQQICDIDEGKIRKWQNALIKYRDEKGNGYAPTYLRTINNQLSTIFNFAVRFYKLRSNPCLAAGFMGKSKADEMNIWTQSYFEEIIKLENKTVYHLLFRLLFYSGAREGEILALTPEDVPRDNAMIDINKNYAVIDGVEYFLTPKTERSIRKVTIPPSLHKDLLDYIDGIYIEPNERIFYFKRSAVNTELQRIMRLANINPEMDNWIRVHDLRHSHASMLIHMGKDIGEISRRLGHDSYKTTWDTYSHLYPGTDRALADDIEKLINSDKQKQNQIQPINIAEDFHEIKDSPFSRESQYILDTTMNDVNPLIHRNSQKIFAKYGIDVDKDQILGYNISAFIDYVAHGNTIVDIISAFRPNENLRNLLLSLFTEAVTTCELRYGSIKCLDDYITTITIPHYVLIYNTNYTS